MPLHEATARQPAAFLLLRILPRITTSLACIAFALSVCPRFAAAQAFTVGMKVEFPTGSAPHQVVMADVNGDGGPI